MDTQQHSIALLGFAVMLERNLDRVPILRLTFFAIRRLHDQHACAPFAFVLRVYYIITLLSQQNWNKGS